MSESFITKRAISVAFKELTKKKSFDKITIVDITELCGLNRQTFYYHFKDKYELVDWIYYNEAISIIVEDLNYDNWDERVLLMLSKMKQDEYFYENTLKHTMENGFREYLFQVTSELFYDIIGRISAQEKVEQEKIRFIAEFYAFGIVGIVISWVQKGMKETPEYITKQLRTLAYGTEKFAVARFFEKNAKKDLSN